MDFVYIYMYSVISCSAFIWDILQLLENQANVWNEK